MWVCGGSVGQKRGNSALLRLSVWAAVADMGRLLTTEVPTWVDFEVLCPFTSYTCIMTKSTDYAQKLKLSKVEEKKKRKKVYKG